MIRNITIRTELNGWICTVGCQTVVFTSKSVLLESLSEYLHNPDAVEKMFIETSVNSHLFPQEERMLAEGPSVHERADIEFQNESESHG